MRFRKIILCFCFIAGSTRYTNGQLSIEGQYHSVTKTFVPVEDGYWIGLFDQGIARINKDGYWGLVDSTGKLICPIEYDIIHPFEGAVAKIGKNRRLALINRKGKIITPFSFHAIYPFAEDIAVCILPERHTNGYINSQGTIITREPYRNLTPFKNGFGRYQKDTVFGIISRQGKEIPVFTYQDYPGTANGWRYYPIDETAHFYDPYRQSNQFEPPSKINLLQFENGLAPVVKLIDRKIKFGFIDTNGHYAVPLIYDSISNFNNGYAAVKKGKYWGVLDSNGKQIINPEYDKITIAAKDFFIVAMNNKYGVINASGQTRIPVMHPFVGYLFNDLYAIFKEDELAKKQGAGTGFREWGPTGKWGILNSSNQLVVPFVYDRIERLNDYLGKAQRIVSRMDLNTGIPRYIETTHFKLITANGITDSTVYTESYTKIGLTYDNHRVFESYHQVENGDVPDDQEPLISLQKIEPTNGPGFTMGAAKITAVAITKQGQKVFELPNTAIRQFRNGYAVIERPGNQSQLRFPVRPSGKLGLVNKAGDIVLAPEYDYIGAYNLMEQIPWQHDMIPVCKKEKWGMVNDKNELLIPIKYKQVRLSFSGIAVASYKGAYLTYGFFDFSGNPLFPVRYRNLHETLAGAIYAEDEQGKRVEMNKKGSIFKD